MLKLFVLNFAIITISLIIAIYLKAKIKTYKAQNICFLVSSILTILCHNSSLLYHLIRDNSQLSYLQSNPNLILPIYPCNLVMWCCLIYALIKSKESKFGLFLADFIFWVGVACCLGGMFANVDFIMNPTLADFDITKSIVAHGFMFFNVILFFTFKRINFDLIRNMKNIFLSVIFMLIDGLYINVLYSVLVSKETAYNINSMFLIHSPFEQLGFLTFPIISMIALLLYFIIFAILDTFMYPKGNKWYNRMKAKH